MGRPCHTWCRRCGSLGFWGKAQTGTRSLEIKFFVKFRAKKPEEGDSQSCNSFIKRFKQHPEHCIKATICDKTYVSLLRKSRMTFLRFQKNLKYMAKNPLTGHCPYNSQPEMSSAKGLRHHFQVETIKIGQNLGAQWTMTW